MDLIPPSRVSAVARTEAREVERERAEDIERESVCETRAQGRRSQGIGHPPFRHVGAIYDMANP